MTEYARGFIMEADEFDLKENASKHGVAELYKKGIRIFKQFGISNQETKRLADQLIIIQKEAAIQLSKVGTITYDIKIPKEIDFPEFDNIYQAIYWFIGIELTPISYCTGLLDNNKDAFLQPRFLTTTMTNSEGSTVGISEDGEKIIYKESSIHRQILCSTVLIPNYNKLVENFSISEMEVYDLVFNSPFISEKHLPIYVHGLYLGFCGDFAVAVHLLIPQLEASLRYLLKNYGVQTTKYSEDIQTENGLTSSLNNLKGILNEDLLFHLEGLLNEPFGDNLRNKISHGLVDLPMLYSTPVFYTWWIALKLSLELDKYIINSKNKVKQVS